MRLILMTLAGVFLVFGTFPSGVADNVSQATENAALMSCPSVQEEIIDLQLLAEGLKNSRAVGFFEKVRLKSSIDDLLRRFDAYHNGVRKFRLEELQQQYDILLMRIATHLQDQDVMLHQQLCNAWEIIWEDLSDPARYSEKFS